MLPKLIEFENYRGILIFKEPGFEHYFIGRYDNFGLGVLSLEEAHTIIDHMF